jgi:hypothetical protein
VKRRKGAVKMQKQRFMSATVGGNSGAILRVEDTVPRPGGAVKRAHIHRGVGPVPSADAKQSRGISAHHIELVVITDTSEDDEN